MNWAELRKDERWVLAAATFALAVIALFPMLGSYGLWDPQEIAIADQARQLVRSGGYWALWHRQLPFTPWASAVGIYLFGASELGARLPLALLGIVAVLATYGAGARLGRPRAGLFAAIALLGAPLFVFQARQLIGDIGAVAGLALAMYGLVGLAWPAPTRRPWQLPLDAAIAALGLAIGLFAAGLFVGVFVPVAAIAVAAASFAPARRFALPAAVAAILILFGCFSMMYHFEPAQAGMRAIFGKTLVAAKDYLPWIGGALRPGPTPMGSPIGWPAFDTVVSQVAFGMFPWTALAPIAVLTLAAPRVRDRVAFGGIAMLGCALGAYVATSLWTRAIGDVRYPALGAIAFALGLFLDDLFAAKVEGDAARLPEADHGLRIGAIFVMLAAFILALDTHNFPDTLPSVHLIGSSVKLPRELMAVEYLVVAFGIAFGAAAATGLFVAVGGERLAGLERRRVVRGGILGTVGVGGVFALFLSLAVVPLLSRHFSYKNLFQSYFKHRKGSEPLGVMGIPGTGPEFYSRGQLMRLETIQQLVDFMRKPERVFAIAPSDRLCALHQSSVGQATSYFVLDNESSRYNLFTNKLAPGEKDESPLRANFHSEAPSHLERAVEANFEDTLELLGADMPAHVNKGSSFKVTLWVRVKKRPTMNYKVFAHFDPVGPGMRFQGDHDQPGICATSTWAPGDIVSDTFEVTAGEMTAPRGDYTLWIGFFTGGSGQYKNMTVLTPNHDANNRVSLGTIRLD